MIFIFISVIQSVFIFITFKFFTRYNIDTLQALVVNYVVAATCGFVLYRDPWTISDIISSRWFLFAILLGATFISTFYVFAISNQRSGIAITSVISKMSVVIPVIAGVILYGDRLKPLLIVGIIIALAAFYLTFLKKQTTPVGLHMLLLPVLVFLGSGMVDTMMKYSQYHYIDGNLFLFLAFVFFSCFTIGSSVLTIRILLKKSRLMPKNAIAGIILGILNFGSTIFLMKAMGKFDSGVLFPVANASIVCLSALTGYFIFREPLSRINWAGVGLSVAAIIIIANA
jgi:drug/metabolite transporter (DMT)-like permease